MNALILSRYLRGKRHNRERERVREMNTVVHCILGFLVCDI